MEIKRTVKLLGLQPELLLGIMVIESIYREYTDIKPVITSVRDSSHSKNSLHYAGFACDFRTHGLTDTERREIHLAGMAALGPEFDWILEPDHYHLEYQPREA